MVVVRGDDEGVHGRSLGQGVLAHLGPQSPQQQRRVDSLHRLRHVLHGRTETSQRPLVTGHALQRIAVRATQDPRHGYNNRYEVLLVSGG